MANPLLALRPVIFETGGSEAVTYTPPGAGTPVPGVRAVRSGDVAGSLSGLGNPLRGISFEIPYSQLVAKPLQEGTITTAEAEVFRITQVTEQGFTASWVLVVEAV